VSATFLSAIDWALAVRPQDRPQSVAALRKALSGPGAAPTRNFRHRAVPGVAGAVTTAALDSWRTTVHLARPVARRTAVAFRPLLAAAVVLLTVAVTVALWWRAPSTAAVAYVVAPAAQAVVAPAARAVDMPAARAVDMPAARAVDTPPSALPVPSAVAGIPIPALPVAASSSGPLADASAPPAAERLPAQRRAEHVARTNAARTSGRALAAEKSGPERRIERARVASPGPIELCAAHNFFLRPFCVRRRCDDQRFRAHSECVQARQAEARRLTELPARLRGSSGDPGAPPVAS
jgi:hypothetical protein